MTRRKALIPLILPFLLCISCKEDFLRMERDAFMLCSTDTDMASKAMDNFPEQTSYYFFAFNRDNSSREPIYSYPAVIQACGTESAGHVISFPEGTRSHFGGRSIDFLALTYADASSEHWNESSFVCAQGNAPVYRMSRNTEYPFALADLRHGCAKDMNSENSTGKVEVDFHHALSKLKFTAARQDSDNLNGIYISEITVSDYSLASLNLADGSWNASGSENELCIYRYEPADPMNPDAEKMLTTSASTVAEALVFPRIAGAGAMRINVKTFNPTAGDEHHINREQILDQEFMLTFADDAQSSAVLPNGLEKNHEYTLSITITNKGVKIIVMNPSEAEWIESEPTDMQLGQPVTFAGITWADRNLGATFAPEHNNIENITNIAEWDNMRGYYYQFGRNVPYFVLKNRRMGQGSKNFYDNFDQNDYTYCNGNTDRTNAPMALLDGNSVQAAYDAAKGNNKTWASIEKGGVMPLSFYDNKLNLSKGVNYIDIGDYDGTAADAKRFAIVAGAAKDGQPWWVIEESKAFKGTPTTWNDVSKQPCPKGWRIPTRDDWAYIMPLSKRTGDITFNPGGSRNNGKYSYTDLDGNVKVINSYCYYNGSNSEFNDHYYNHNKSADGKTVWWHEIGGDRKDVKINDKLYAGLEESFGDPVEGAVSEYLCESPANAITRGTLYAIKFMGRSEAYRLKWEFIIHSDMPPVGARSGKNIYPVTMRISRYPSSASERIRTPEEKNSLDWDHPAEVMELPDCGYIFTETKPYLVNAGNETIYACQTIDPQSGYYYAVRLKYNEFTDGGSLGSRYLMLIKMMRAYGMCIRPVRDNTIVID